jgi:hypothetical protein
MVNLDVEEDAGFQRALWRVQHIAWGVMAVFVLAGLVGLLGSGPASRGVAESANAALSVEYERFLRKGAPTTLRVELGPDAEPGRIVLWIARSYLDRVRIESILPSPMQAVAADGGVAYVFAVQSGERLAVLIHLQAAEAGRLQAWLRRGGGAGLDFNQWVYP